MRNLFTALLLTITFGLQAQLFTKLKTFDKIDFGNSGYQPVAAFDNKICYKLGNPSDPHLLFVTDGTEAGTVQVDAITQFDYFDSFENTDAQYLYYVKEISGQDRVLVRMNKSSYAKEDLGTDFTFSKLTFLNNKLYYFSGSDFKQLDPATKQKSTIKASLAAQGGLFMTIFNNKLAILHKNFLTNKTSLSISDGTSAGTVEVKEFGIDAGAVTRVEGPWIHGGKLYFTMNARYAGVWDKSLWVSDGTSSGTLKLKQIQYQDVSSAETKAISGGDYLYFSGAEVGTTVLKFFRTDGTEAGTVKLGVDKVQDPSSFVNYKGKTYFTGNDLSNKSNFYAVSGDNVEITYDFNSVGVTLSSPFVFNDSLFFVGNNSDLGSEFWKSDGSVAGLTAIPQGNKAASASIFQTTVSGKYIYYSKRVNGQEKELWVYDPKKYVASVKPEIETIAIHPNPATNYIQLPDFIQGGTMEIIDITGKRIIKQINKNNTVDISALPTGIFIIRIFGQNKSYISKFIKL